MEIRDITVRFGGIVPLSALSVDFKAGITGLIGPNGAGKTTLLNVLSGFVTSASGDVFIDGKSLQGVAPRKRAQLGLRRTFQQERIAEDLSLFDNLLAAADHLVKDRRTARKDVEKALDFAGLSSAAAKMGRKLNLFERRIGEVAKTLLGHPRIILLDEPGAGLTESESGRLRALVGSIPEIFGANVVLIDHDADLIAATCQETLVLDFGRKLAFGITETVLRDPQVRAAYLGEGMQA